MVSISLWFIAVRAPLWLDETYSFWEINTSFWKIPSHQGGLSALWFPAYPCILRLAANILGTSEIALRIPSILAMSGAVYVFYRAVRELFGREVAILTAVIFCAHPIVIFAAIDVRPYAFATLVLSLAFLLLVRLRASDSLWLAALFGFSAAVIVYFHFLFAVILPSFAIVLFIFKARDRNRWRQFGTAFVVFGLAFLPVIPGLLFIFRTSGTHGVDFHPTLMALGLTLAPGWLAYIIGVTALAAVILQNAPKVRVTGARVLIGVLLVLALALLVHHAMSSGVSIYIAIPPLLICILGSAALIATMVGRADRNRRANLTGIWLSAALALIPILILYWVSVGMSIHVFTPRYRLVAIPGIALYWAFLVSRIDSRAIRVLFCVALVGTTAYQYLSSPSSKRHEYTWKYALEAAQANASADNAPVLICSDFPESDHMPMPLDSAKDSVLFTPLSYYRLSVPVVPLPRSLNEETVRVGSAFLQNAARQRFLALAYSPSYKTLRWIASASSATHEMHELGVFDGVEVLEFTPRAGKNDSR